MTRRLHLAIVLLVVLLAGGCGRTNTTQLSGDGGGTDSTDRDYPPGVEICDNQRDDDGDDLVDCDDPECASHRSCRPGREICDNGRDDDGDNLVDCDDFDCVAHSSCRPGREICDNYRDDDEDGYVDCQDSDCYADPLCNGPRIEICDNYIDDDEDGFTDCQDSDCYGDPWCDVVLPEECTNNIDDDHDGFIDCYDSDCYGHPACDPTQEFCDNGIDDDGDGATDCDDSDCAQFPACQPGTEKCTNGVDDDGDGAIDCDDKDCATHPACQPGTEKCTNGVDDDGDYLTDCDDPDCFKHPDCKKPGIEICNNDLDDDEDGAIDCDDDDCANLPICQPGVEVCDNGKDDDGDGATDCDDPDCANFPACQTLLCQPLVDFGTLAAKGGASTRTIATAGTSDVYQSPCAVPGGGEVVSRFTLSGDADVKLDYNQTVGDHVFSLFRAGIGEACNANPAGCYDPEGEKVGSFGIKQLAAGEYYLIVEAFADALEGSVIVTLSTGTVQKVENCANGIDDDEDGATDCADLDCALAPECASQLCKVDENIGTLVIDGPEKTVTVTTAGGLNDVEEACAAGGGEDRVIRVVMPESGILAVETSQQGWHVYGLHLDKGPGTVCTADKGSCFDSAGTPAFQISYGAVAKGVYYYVVDALNPGEEGYVQLTFRALSNRGPELCANEIDDDGDGLVDCMDPDCAGVIGCPGPVCVADQKAGALSPSSSAVSVTANTSANNNDQTVPCALGGGKDVVISLELTEVSGLAISCTQNGDHVLGLFAAGKPRDPCDKISTNCADITNGPFGCNFVFPNNQPGKYYLVVEAFKPGSEGTVDLYLSAVSDHAQEICNNGKDDDGDGKIDCQDSNCATKPICSGETCTPDQKIGLLPVGGAMQNVAVTTSGAGDSNSASCALGGGEDAVVEFYLAQSGTVSIDFAQFGEHVFALYENKGAGFSCDAAPVACQPTNGQSTGKISFASVPAGNYYLVIEAVTAGSEGSAVMQMSAQ